MRRQEGEPGSEGGESSQRSTLWLQYYNMLKPPPGTTEGLDFKEITFADGAILSALFNLGENDMGGISVADITREIGEHREEPKLVPVIDELLEPSGVRVRLLGLNMRKLVEKHGMEKDFWRLTKGARLQMNMWVFDAMTAK